jgi:hypothetical protein
MPGLDGTGKLFAPIIPFLQPHFNLVIVTYPDLDSFPISIRSRNISIAHAVNYRGQAIFRC